MRSFYTYGIIYALERGGKHAHGEGQDMTGEALKAWRETHGWNQTQAARYFGTTQVNVSRWEQGVYSIPEAIAFLVYLYRHARNIRDIETLLYTAPERTENEA